MIHDRSLEFARFEGRIITTDWYPYGLITQSISDWVHDERLRAERICDEEDSHA